MLDEGPLEGGEFVPISQSLDGADVSVVEPGAQHQTGVDGLVVNEHRARPALAFQAALFRSGE